MKATVQVPGTFVWSLKGDKASETSKQTFNAASASAGHLSSRLLTTT